VLQSLNEMYRLLTYLSSQLPLASTGLKLLKTAHMQHFDVHILNALLELKNTLEKEWAAEKFHASALQQTVMMDQRQLAKNKRRLEQKREQVRELSEGPDIHLGSKSCIEDYSIVGNFLLKGDLNLGKRRMEFDANCEITRVTKTCSGGSKWLDEDLRGTSWRAILTANLFRDIDGTATFYTTSAVKHRSEIRALHAAIAELEENIEDLEAACLRRSQDDGRAKALGESLAGLGQVIHMIKMDTFSIEIWSRVRSLYLSNRRPSKQEIEIFVSAFDANVAKLL
jgi:hemoglobin-like flavoprotein